jgi:hypothetical protein
LPSAHSPPTSLLQLALDSAGAREDATVHLLEIVVRGVKHESAGDADGDADCAVVELDRKTLNMHGNSTPGERRNVLHSSRSNRLFKEVNALASSDARLI